MEITGDTGLFGLFGYPIKQTLSPLIHNTAFRETGLNSIYLAFPVKPSNLQEATQAIKALGMTGINVTSPHKEKIIDCMNKNKEIKKRYDTLFYARLVGQGFFERLDNYLIEEDNSQTKKAD